MYRAGLKSQHLDLVLNHVIQGGSDAMLASQKDKGHLNDSDLDLNSVFNHSPKSE